ncbi:MAG: type II toxin-antitoxin system RelE/ParE family toxin [Gemmatimonas sp.]
MRMLPEPAQNKLGLLLERVQLGETPHGSKSMRSDGNGVMELRAAVAGAFRLIYVMQLADAIYVLHVFQKKSEKTSMLDLQLARVRFQATVREREEL